MVRNGNGLLPVLVCAMLCATVMTWSDTRNPEPFPEVHVGSVAHLPPLVQLSERERSAIRHFLAHRLDPVNSDSEDFAEVIKQAPERHSSKMAPDDNRDPEPEAAEDYAKSKRDSQGRFGPNIGPFITNRQIEAWTSRASGTPALKETDLALQSTWKRKANGKLCYINPIACFGRRQREAARK
ncbi:hypothetical protein BV898_00469 [Hypsibius exemplaris]|uniref:Uncharacterized protein n=1 Tax=Hypsibius exemplaris TaxID=2072580 RepID=A0A1W0XDL2_HYPEX|nr:hypothetical protein BV898_00469 [Hypsibius exemplaris]